LRSTEEAEIVARLGDYPLFRRVFKYQFEALYIEGQNNFYTMRVQIACFKYRQLYGMATGQQRAGKSNFACIALGTSIKL
jgi:hypothetical protein